MVNLILLSNIDFVDLSLAFLGPGFIDCTLHHYYSTSFDSKPFHNFHGKVSEQPGFEPRTLVFAAVVLTTELPHHAQKHVNIG